MSRWLGSAVQVAGAGALVTGVALWNTAAAFIVGGLFTIAFGVGLERGNVE